jgi:hypothetical protein
LVLMAALASVQEAVNRFGAFAQSAEGPPMTAVPIDPAGGSFTRIDTDLPGEFFPITILMDVDSRTGNPVLLYTRRNEPGLTSTLIRCADPGCERRTTLEVPVVNLVDMVLQPMPEGEGVPVLLLTRPEDRTQLNLERCDDPACTTRTHLMTVTGPGGYLPAPGQLVATDAGPLFAYFDPGNNWDSILRLTDCRVLPCQTYTIDDSTGLPNSDVALDVFDSVPVIVYNVVTGIALARCEAAESCNRPSINLIYPNNLIPEAPRPNLRMALDGVGRPHILHQYFRRMLLATCADSACSSVNNQPFDDMPLSFYTGFDLGFGASGDLYAAYRRLDQQAENSTSYDYLMLQRCTPLDCTLRSLTDLPVSYLGDLVVRDDRVYIQYVTQESADGDVVYSIRLYVGEPPPVPQATPGPSLTPTPTRTPDWLDLTATAEAPQLIPAFTWTPTPPG